MPRPIQRLTPIGIKNIKQPGRHPDGGNLYLNVSNSGTKSWIFLYTLRGKTREMGLGPVQTVSLTKAREEAKKAKELLQAGIDPIEQRAANEQAKKIARLKQTTFDQCAAAFIAMKRSDWKNAKHAAQWETTLKQYVSPVFGDLPVDMIDTPLVLKAISGIWNEKRETASRVLNRIENILDYAKTNGYRSGDNPARWDGVIQHALPSKKKITKKVRHHPAVPIAEMHDFMNDLRTRQASSARAIEFLVLTAARTNEVIGARWEEINLKSSTWTIPGERMKAGEKHNVPLTSRALEILSEMAELRDGDNPWIFPGERNGKPLSNMAMLNLLQKRMGRTETIHGFRSTFRDWAALIANERREVAEAALAHAQKDKTEASYLRTDFFEPRRRLMARWQEFLETPFNESATVITFSKNSTAVG